MGQTLTERLTAAKASALPPRSAYDEALEAAVTDHEVKRLKNAGVIPSARLVMGTAGANTETVTIGGHVFKYVTALGAAAAQTQVKVQGTAAGSRAKLVLAINGIADALNIVPATTPFALSVLADQVDTDK